MKRPPIKVSDPHSEDKWENHKQQILTYSWLRSKQEDSKAISAGIILYLNELVPSKEDLVLIKEEITNKNYQKGDLVIVEKTRYDVINKGDEIFAYSVTSTGKANVEVGVVGEKYDNQKAIAYENGASFSEEYVIGKADKVYHNLGSYLSIVESKWGFLFIVLVPGFTIFLYELYALIVEIKYGDEEEEKAQ